MEIEIVSNRRKTVSKKGFIDIDLIIKVKGEGRKIVRAMKVKPEYWDEKKNWISTKHPEFSVEDARLSGIINNLKETAATLRIKNRSVSMKEISKIMVGGTPAGTFNAYYENVIKSDKFLTPSSKSSYNQTLNVLNDYDNNILFQHMTPGLVRSFNNHIKGLGYSHNSIAKHAKNMTKIINMAIQEDLMTKNPYKGQKTGFIVNEKDHLEDAEVKLIEKLDYSGRTDKIEVAKDMFLFSCYTGLRFCDVQTLTGDNLVKDNGATVLIKVMEKLKNKGKKVKLPIEKLYNGKAMEIWKKYYNPERTFLFPFITNQEINRWLKDIQSDAEIGKKLMFKTSRDTFACKIARETGDATLVKELMGHSKLETSMIYVKLTNQDVSNKVDRIKW